MLQKLKNHLHQNFPFLKGQKLLITVSGGIDSIVLTHLFHQLNYSIAIAHCNFQLRGLESDLDEQFVQKTAKNLNIQFHSTQFLTKEYCKKNKVNTQIGARELRYTWFQKLCKEYQYDFILTAHHLNDVMETFFINLARGTGLDGLSGIPPINNNIVRPLLLFSRAEIHQFAEDKNIKWREDKSNAETKYIRNKIRHNITPELYKLHPNFEANFLKSIQNIHQSKTYINHKIDLLRDSFLTPKDDNFIIDKNEFKKLSTFEIYKLLKPYGFTTSDEILKLLNSQTGKQLKSETHILLNNRDALILSENIHFYEDETYEIKHMQDVNHLPIPLTFSFAAKELSNNCTTIDMEVTTFPLILRKWKEGDYFYPTGMIGKKKISKYFKDEKLSLRDKENTWILCNNKDQIIWIVGLRADRKLTSKASKDTLVFISIK